MIALNHHLSDQQVRQFASQTAQALKDRICPVGYARAHPCGERDVRQDADSGLIAYLYIYGISNPSEIAALSEMIKLTRRSNVSYKKIPVRVVFYSDLNKTSINKSFWMLGE
jgi:hypothetical protein